MKKEQRWKENKAIKFIQRSYPKEKFKDVRDNKELGYDLKGKTKIVEVKYRLKLGAVSITENEFKAFEKYKNFFIYFVTGSINNLNNGIPPIFNWWNE